MSFEITDGLFFVAPPLHRFLQCYAIYSGLVCQGKQAAREGDEEREREQGRMEKLDKKLSQLSTDDWSWRKQQSDLTKDGYN